MVIATTLCIITAGNEIKEANKQTECCILMQATIMDIK